MKTAIVLAVVVLAGCAAPVKPCNPLTHGRCEVGARAESPMSRVPAYPVPRFTPEKPRFSVCKPGDFA